MPPVINIKSTSYLKSHAAQISEELEMNGNPFFITLNGEASMVIESWFIGASTQTFCAGTPG